MTTLGAEGAPGAANAGAGPRVGALTVDGAGLILTSDAAACAALGAPASALIGAPLSLRLEGVEGLAGPNAPGVRLRVRRRAGTGRTVELIASDLLDGRRTILLCEPAPPHAAGEAAVHAGSGERETELRLLAEHRAFLLELGDRLRNEADPRAIIQETQARLGERLAVSRVGYAEVDPAGVMFEVHGDWTDGSVASVGGRYPMAMLGERALADYGAGRARVSPDLAATGELLPALQAMQIAASVTTPLIKGGRLVGMLSVQQSRPRPWTAAEVQLIEEVAERTWAALEWARAEVRMRASEGQFRTLAENMPDICWVADADISRSWYNKRGEAVFGRQGVSTLDLPALCHPDELDSVLAAWAAARERGERLEQTCRLLTRDGDYRPFLSRAVPVRDHTGRVVQWCGVLTDITEQRAAEQRLGLLQQLSEALKHEVSADAILSRTTEILGRRLGASRVCYSECEEPGGDAMRVARLWTDGASPELGPRQRHSSLGQPVVDHHRRGLTLVVGDSADHPLIEPEASARYIGAGYRAGVDVPLIKEGLLVAFLSVHQITPRVWAPHEVALIEEVAERTWAALERARAEEQRQETQALLSAITENAPIGIYLKDAQGRYLLANPEMARLMGRSLEEILGRTAADLMPSRIAARVADSDQEVLRNGGLISVEAHIPGRPIYEWSLVMRFPVQSRPGAPTQIAGFDIDITAQKKAEAELKRSQESLNQSEKLSALGSLLAGVSHELNNPLSIIVAQAVMMERQAAGTPLAERAGKIRKAADRSARIVQTFLAMARRKRPERKRTDLNGVVLAALELTDYGSRAGGVAVVRDLSPDLPPLWADADQLHQVVVNLIINAQQAMAEQPPPRRLTVRTRRDGDAVIIEVADSGPGVPEAIRRRIFDPFFTTKPQSAGTGVGLSFSQGLVEAHGGRLELAESEIGACFRVAIPIQGVNGAEPAAGDADASAGPPRRTALIVDDEPEIAESLADLLQLEGFESEIAVGGRAAQARLAEAASRFDLIVSDLRMPDLDGPTLFAWLKAERPEAVARVAFATGDTLGAAAVRFLADAGRPYVEKPFTPESLQRLVAEVDARRPGPEPL